MSRVKVFKSGHRLQVNLELCRCARSRSFASSSPNSCKAPYSFTSGAWECEFEDMGASDPIQRFCMAMAWDFGAVLDFASEQGLFVHGKFKGCMSLLFPQEQRQQQAFDENMKGYCL